MLRVLGRDRPSCPDSARRKESSQILSTLDQPLCEARELLK